MAGIKLEFIAEVKPLLRGTKDVEAALDDVAGSLDDVARDAKVAGDKAGRALGDGVDDARVEVGQSTAKMETSFRDMARAADTHSRKAGDDIGSNTKKGMVDSADSVDEFKKESVANFSEVASSFTGDMSQAADGVQGIMGGLAGALPGPAGIAAGVLAGVGGALLSSFTVNAEAAEARVSAMYDDMLESGDLFLSEKAIQDALAAIYSDTGERAISWGNLLKIVEATGVEESVVARAYAGDAVAQRELMAGLGDAYDANNQKAISGSQSEQAESIKTQQELDRIRQGVLGIATEHDNAVTKVAGYQAAVQQMSGVTQAEARAIKGGFDNIQPDRTVAIKIAVDLAAAEQTIRSWTPPMVTIKPQVRPGYMNP